MAKVEVVRNDPKPLPLPTMYTAGELMRSHTDIASRALALSGR